MNNIVSIKYPGFGVISSEGAKQLTEIREWCTTKWGPPSGLWNMSGNIGSTDFIFDTEDKMVEFKLTWL